MDLNCDTSRVSPVSLVRSDVTWRRAAPTSGCTSPKDLVGFLVPRLLMVVYILDGHGDRIPSIGISARRRVVVVTRNEDITEPFPLRRGEHGVQDVDCPPIGEKVPLLITRPGMIAKIEIVVDTGGKFEVVARTT